MKSAKHKVKDGKVHKKARVARFITNNFYFWYANKVMDMPNTNQQPVRQPVNHKSNISKHQNQNIKKNGNVTNFTSESTSTSNSKTNLHEDTNEDQNTNSINDNILEIETINRPFPECVLNVIPRSFDIVQRGPLPSIVFHNNKIKIIES